MNRTSLILLLVFLSPGISLTAADPPARQLLLPGETFQIEDSQAFIMLPPKSLRTKPQPWIWYAPTLPGLPDQHEKWMHEKFISAGIAVAGIDVGESFGNAPGRDLYTKFYEELTKHRDYARRPVMLCRSRGGLMILNWAVEHPESVAGIAGIYPVFDFRTYPGLPLAATAYRLSPEELDRNSAQHNPVERVASLAKLSVPVFLIHGDVDEVVPLKQNSAELLRRYQLEHAEKSVQLVVAPGQGHNFWEGFFHSQELVDFVIRQARPRTLAP